MRIAVTGAGGTVGGQVVRLLAAAEGGHRVVALSRRGPTLRGVDTAYADYADLDSLRAALRGVDTLVFISGDGDAAKVLLHHENVVTAAARSGVAHIVALSGLDADVTSPFCYGVTNGHTERLLAGSGCAWSVARASIFTEFFAGLLAAARSGDRIEVPAADGRVSLVSRTDVGRCLAALALGAPTGVHHDITGPAAYDLGDLAALAGATYTDIDPADYVRAMAAAGEDPWWMYAYATMLTTVREGRWESVSGEVLRLTGRVPVAPDELLDATGAR
ncbi:NAD(P)H-binding protein [Streptomyces sp. 184]|uniref:NAD(P)H-binding protein n=1 Tax=Streptomyces sp. 184 TaxID=1827526 RepID=UPI0038921DCB